jgi:hypothetical protein
MQFLNTPFNKALATLIAGLVTLLAAHNVPLPAFLQDPTVQGTISALIIAGVTYLVPNKKPDIEAVLTQVADVVAHNVAMGVAPQVAKAHAVNEGLYMQAAQK